MNSICHQPNDCPRFSATRLVTLVVAVAVIALPAALAMVGGV